MDPETLKQVAASYERDGYATVEAFLSEAEVQQLKDEAGALIKSDECQQTELQIFGNEFNMQSRYFLDSNDKICFFFERNSVDLDTRDLLLPRDKSLAKIGHALHHLNDTFKRATASAKVRDLFRALAFERPVVSQSMLIFKNPKCGGAYTPHQDASFIHTEPTRLVGFWIALDDATVENGCLEFIPGSHRWPLARKFARTGNTRDGEKLLDWSGPVVDYTDEQFVKVPIGRGGLALIHGLVVHRSAQNLSDSSRWAYTFHAWDSSASVYSAATNWNSPSEAFTPL